MSQALHVADVLSILESAYCLDGTEAEWSSKLLVTLDRTMGVGLSAFACGFRGTARGAITIERESAAVLRQAPEAVSAIFDGLTTALPRSLVSGIAARQRTQCMLTSEVDPNGALPYRQRLARDGIVDGLNISCMDINREGFLISLGLSGRTQLDQATRRNLQRIAVHILAARRVRKRLSVSGERAAAAPRSDADPDAVLSAEGAVLHADGEAKLAVARRALTQAVRNVEKARSSLRQDADRALSLWRGLVSARWTLIDRFQSNGTRYVVARHNPSCSSGRVELTPAEQAVVAYTARNYSTKETAYALGISDSTVRVLLMRAARRLGARNREELLDMERRRTQEDEE